MGRTACFADLAGERSSHSKGLKARLPEKAPPKRLLQRLFVTAVWGFIKACQMAWIMQTATEERMEVPESLSGLSTYVIVVIIMKRHSAFFSHSQSTFPYIPNINSS
jgi:hypothetical protein